LILEEFATLGDLKGERSDKREREIGKKLVSIFNCFSSTFLTMNSKMSRLRSCLTNQIIFLNLF